MVPPSQSGAGSLAPSAMHVQLPQLSACVLQSAADWHWVVLPPSPPELLPPEPSFDEAASPWPPLELELEPEPLDPVPLGLELVLHAHTARRTPRPKIAFTPSS
jgi:hypothetical protein